MLAQKAFEKNVKKKGLSKIYNKFDKNLFYTNHNNQIGILKVQHLRLFRSENKQVIKAVPYQIMRSNF